MTADVQPERFKAFALDGAALSEQLADAPELGLKSRSAAARSQAILTLPAPDGTLQRFRVEETPVMAPELAERHPGIKTYAGVGVDDPSAMVHADSGPLGFHASVRSGEVGDWLVDPYSRTNQRTYLSYYGDGQQAEALAEEEPQGPEPETATKSARAAAAAAPEVILRSYRLALANDHSYAAFFGSAENVLASKVTLISRVNQIYESEVSTRLLLIDETESLNLATPALTTGANGPCGSAPCFTPAQIEKCDNPTIIRNQVVLGQLVGASKFDVGHVLLARDGGGIAYSPAAAGVRKGGGCSGLLLPNSGRLVGLVAHEIGHQFSMGHTFNGVAGTCTTANRVAASSYEPGSGQTIMSYAGSCDRDNVQQARDPYFHYYSRSQANTYTTMGYSAATYPAIDEIQNVSLRDFDGTDSFTLSLGGVTSAPITRGGNYTPSGIMGTLLGSEVQTVDLTGYNANGDSYRLNYQGADTEPIVRGVNDTPFGVQNALAGGNERQQVTLTGYNSAVTSFRIRFGDKTSAQFGQGGLAMNANNVQLQLNAITGGTVLAPGASTGGFVATFGGTLARTDLPQLEIIGCTCGTTVRTQAHGGQGVAGWPAQASVVATAVADSGYGIAFTGSLLNTDVPLLTITNAVGASGTVTETAKAGPSVLPAGATVVVAPFANGPTFDDTGFQLTYGGTFAGKPVDRPTLNVTGGSGFVGQAAQGGPTLPTGYIQTPTGNHVPVTASPETEYYDWNIPTRTPFALTEGATDEDGDRMTHLWTAYDRGVAGPTYLLSNTKRDGALFSVFPHASAVSREDPLREGVPNHPDNNPTRVFPDMAQILAGNTNAATGRCPEPPAEPAPVPPEITECYAEFLPTSDWVGAVTTRRELGFLITARDGRPGGAGVTDAYYRAVLDPTAGPFRVTSHGIAQTAYATSSQTVKWDVAGTDRAPIALANVKISLSTDGGLTYPHVLSESTPNDGSAEVQLPDVTAAKARLKVEAVGNVFFDVNHADFAIAAAPTGTVGGSVPATLALTLGAPAVFPPFVPGADHDYTATAKATVISTAGDAALTVSDPGRLTNGAFSLAEPLRVAFSKSAWTGPVSNDNVDITFNQRIKANDPLRTGTYSRTLTFTLSTTTP